MQFRDPARVLVVDDDPSARELAAHAVRREGLTPVEAPTARRAVSIARHDQVAAVVLDLGLPDRDGFTVLHQLTSASRAATLVVSADAHEASRVAALRLGADDYVVKPASMAELGARITALLRRTAAERQACAPVGSQLSFGGCLVDLHAHEVRRGGRAVGLTPRERGLLAHLVTHPGRAFTRQQLLTAVWGSPWFTAETVTEHVRTLRHKLGPDAARHIVTVRGVGYRFDPRT